jgi:malonate transporter MadL subunit
MIIYGTALLALCHLLGIFLGDVLGHALGVKTNVGGVGIAMLLLIFARLYLVGTNRLPRLSELGVEYWGAMYIPVVVAMAATQDMVAALRGGPVAVLSAIGAVALCAVVIAFINRTERIQPDTAAERPILHDNPLLAEAE